MKLTELAILSESCVAESREYSGFTMASTRARTSLTRRMGFSQLVIVEMIKNLRNGVVWKNFMANSAILQNI